MFLRTKTREFTEGCSAQIERLKAAIAEADALVIGAGAGLSTAAGLSYGGERFLRYFSDFAAKYGFSDMYSGGFFPYKTFEEHWAYWSRYIFVNRYMDAPTKLYADLLALVSGKDYFVITTNVDHCFQKAGFAKERLFYTQGDYGLFQCSEPCCEETFANETIVRKMLEFQGFKVSDRDLEPQDYVRMRIPGELVPHCPRCGRPLTMNLRSDDTFVEDEGWHAAANRYSAFLGAREHRRILFLELGVGYNTPVIIKYPFWRMTERNPKATYACLNMGEALAPSSIRGRSICINSDLAEVIQKLQKPAELQATQ